MTLLHNVSPPLTKNRWKETPLTELRRNLVKHDVRLSIAARRAEITAFNDDARPTACDVGRERPGRRRQTAELVAIIRYAAVERDADMRGKVSHCIHRASRLIAKAYLFRVDPASAQPVGVVVDPPDLLLGGVGEACTFQAISFLGGRVSLHSFWSLVLWHRFSV